jgi:hypothetical protein
LGDEREAYGPTRKPPWSEHDYPVCAGGLDLLSLAL